MTNNFWILLGSISCALCVMIGAFGAHILKDVLNQYSKNIYQTAVSYHFFHSIALIINGILAKNFIDLNFDFSGYLFLLGIILFSFSLYALAVTDIKVLGAITPIGGVCFIIAWIYIAFQIYSN